MPIEPTSVSKQPIREVEPTSANFGSWTSMQGSSTGGKDRPLNSVWEKAINGAQKLFGSEKSEPSPLEEKGETEDRAESNEARSSSNESNLGVAPGFGGRRFGRFGGAAFGGNTFGTVVTSRAAPEAKSNEFDRSGSFDAPREAKRSELAPKERISDKVKTPVQEAPAKEKVVVEIDTEDEAKSHDKLGDVAIAKPMQKGMVAAPLMSPPPLAQVTTLQADTALPQQQATVATSAVNQPNTPVAPQTSVAPQTPASKATTVQTPLAPAQNGNLGTPPSDAKQTQAATLSAAVATARTLTNAKPEGAVPQTVPEPVASSRIEKLQAPVTDGVKKLDTPVASLPTEAQTKLAGDAPLAKDAPVAKDSAAPKETLGFDVAKAKEAVSEATAKAANRPVSQNAPSTPTTSQATAQTAPPVGMQEAASKSAPGESSNTRLPELGAAEAKDGSSTDATKRDLAIAAQQRLANSKPGSETSSQARSGNSEGVGLDPKTGQPTAAAKGSANQYARESAVAAAARIQSPTTQGKGTATTTNTSTTTGVNGVSGGPMQAAGGMAQGAQQGSSQNSDGDPAAKQDFNAAMKQATPSKGGEKSLDGGQSFDAKVEAAANRRSEAAGKASQTSYVSKTAAEVKEVVATLTKSIDRLVTDKGGAMNLKINFEGGGSLNLKISMEGGKITTAMQTDVSGLEGAIKANWGELANDWNQKGVKLSTPQFQNSESGKDSSFENLSEFASKERQAEGRNGDARGRGRGQSSANRGFSNGTAEGTEANSPGAAQKESVVSDKEVNTYA